MGCARQRSNTPVAEATGVVAEAAGVVNEAAGRGAAALELMRVAEAAGVVAEAAGNDDNRSKVETGIGNCALGADKAKVCRPTSAIMNDGTGNRACATCRTTDAVGVAGVAAPFNACGLNIRDHRPSQLRTVPRGNPVNVETIVDTVEWGRSPNI